MRILAIETAHPPGSVALAEGTGTMEILPLGNGLRTTESFAAQIQLGLGRLGWAPDSIDIVATSTGPGSFTGLRIGVTAAKVFSYATGARVFAANTLRLIASQVPTDGEIEVVMDAQRGELFVAGYAREGESLKQLREVSIVAADQWLESRPVSATLTGPGLAKVKGRLGDEAKTADEADWIPQAEQLARLAAGAEPEDFVEPFTLVPNYFRKSAAEEKADKAEVQNS